VSEPFHVPGVLSAEQLADTANSLAALQLPNGMIEWFPGGHSDPWNHIEAAMALAVSGNHDAAERAYQWLVDLQRADGAWHQYYLAGDIIEQDKLDANCVAYIATGVWHHWLLTGDRGFLESMWSVIELAIEFVIELQQPRGEIRWARHADGTPWSFALLTGNSSICHSLRCAIAVAHEMGHERPGWELAMSRLAHVIRTDEGAFAPKERWAMDWYYPVLCGAVSGDQGRARMLAGEEKFMMPGKGIRCVSDRPWITSAETCEAALAWLSLGDRDKAHDLFVWSQAARDTDGAYFTGIVYPQEVNFPADERSSYTAAAVILTADALAEYSPASRLLSTHDSLPPLIDLADSGDDHVADEQLSFDQR